MSCDSTAPKPSPIASVSTRNGILKSGCVNTGCLGLVAHHRGIPHGPSGPVQSAEDGLHQTLERCWCIAEPKRHHSELIQPERGSECCLPFVFVRYFELPVSTRHVQCGEPCCSAECF
ncbi:conserved hypothetical protein [Trichinella spiralis]|uniref:hypothetical protein n=1 Tax=Trichinella spiralis TaxID=6334 RepID=UPI0001EFBD7D|nr:conserved hypothetical protein [Trichinella spiralis]